MKKCTLIIKDEVNIKFEGLDINTRRKLKQKLEFFIPHARHTPAYKLGRWDGKVSFCDIGARSYLNLLDKLIPIVQSEGYDIDIDDRRVGREYTFDEVVDTSYSHIPWPEDHPKAGEPIVLRDYQANIINNCLRQPQSLVICPTAGGKTICCAILSHKAEAYGRSVVIVPTKDLVTQTEEDYINLGLDVGVYYGDRKEWGKTHTICTWQSLDVLDKAKGGAIDEFLEGVACVIVDECHKAKADVLRRILSGSLGKVALRWGLTGTLPEEDHEKVAVLATIGEVSKVITAVELQDKGYLSNLHIDIIQTQDVAPLFDGYQSELKWLVTDKKRIQFLADHIQENIVESGNTLILVDRVETGKKLEESIPDSVFIYSQVKSKDRKTEYKSAQKQDNKVFIATYGVASTGINIPRIFNLVLIEPGKSFVRVIQSIGRGLRIAKDKDFVNVYDITANCKFSKRHLAKRKQFYRNAEYPHKVNKVSY